jgi:serine/threonine-protein kinase
VDSYTPEDVGRETEGLPEAVRAIVHRALRRDPAERYASAEEMRHHLRTQLIALAPGYGRREAAEELAEAISDASATRQTGVPAERDVLPEHMDEHELLSEG